MRQIAMFLVGFTVVAMAGVAIAQTSVLAGDPRVDTWTDTAVESAELPEFQVIAPGAAQKDAAAVTRPAAKTRAAASSDGSAITQATSDEIDLVVTQPSENARVESSELRVSGSTIPGAFVWSGDHAAVVEADGAWAMTVPLVRGKNVIWIGAKLDGETKTVSRTVYHGDQLVWSITQKVKGSETPFEKFHGTGSPGMVITATSPRGSATTTIPPSGDWLLGIGFDSAPGTSFPVTVTTSTGWTKTYTFEHIGSKKTTASKDWTIVHAHTVSHEPYTKFYGTGPVGTRVVATSAFGSAETTVGKDGGWHLKVRLDMPAGATVDIRVTNSLGFDRTYRFTHHASEFSVEQVFGSSAEDPPYEIFRGRTAPLTWVKARSEYGWTKVESNADGWFEVKLVFEGVPIDTPFGVDVIDAAGNKKSFSFVRR
jgi:hypothetical protein